MASKDVVVSTEPSVDIVQSRENSSDFKVSVVVQGNIEHIDDKPGLFVERLGLVILYTDIVQVVAGKARSAGAYHCTLHDGKKSDTTVKLTYSIDNSGATTCVITGTRERDKELVRSLPTLQEIHVSLVQLAKVNYSLIKTLIRNKGVIPIHSICSITRAAVFNPQR